MGIVRGVHCMSKDSGENLSCSCDMQSSLRDLIEDVLWKNFDEAAPSLSMRDMADAVIAELEMTRESAVDGISPVDDPPPGQHRYVTDWIDDD